MKLSLALSALALLACPATAVDLDPAEDCHWPSRCARFASNCCMYAAEQANTTCPMSRAKYYYLLSRCNRLFEDSAGPYNKTDCVTAAIAGIAMTMGDRSLDFPGLCTIDAIKDMP